MDESLVEHLKLSAKRGLSREDVKKLLLSAGWPEVVVKEYIAASFKVADRSTLLEAHCVCKSFGDNVVLDGVDLEIKRGEIFGIIGLSGSGKTTLLNVLVGMVRPSRGDVVLQTAGGVVASVVQNPAIIKKQVGFSTQVPSFYKKLTVRENVAHFAKLYGLSETDVRERTNALLDLVGLKDAKDMSSGTLSGGMQKRLDIACALVHDPQILILDEPTADLDPILRKQLWSLIRQINAKGTTIVLASHFLAEIELLCTRIAILHKKKILELGTAAELRALYAHNYEVYVQCLSQNYDSLISALKFRKQLVRVEEGELIIQTAIPEEVLSLIGTRLKKGDVQQVQLSRPTLGKVFESVVKQ